MVHRIDSPISRPHTGTSVSAGVAVGVESFAPTRIVVVASAVLIGASALLMALSVAGVAGILPVGPRAAVVCLVAVTLPGLPVAALLRLPLNGIFGAVTIALSLATNIVLAQLNIVAELNADLLIQIVLLVASAAATVRLATRPDTLRRNCIPAEKTREDSGWNTVPAGLIEGVLRRRMLAGGLVAALLLFGVTVLRLNVNAAQQFGLIQALGVEYFVGLGLLAMLLAVEFRRLALDKIAVAATNVVLMIYVTMPVAWATGVAPFPTAFAHRYITNWIAAIDVVPPAVDARMSWAGFFSAGAHLMSISGLADSAPFLASASLVFSILMIFPVYAIGMAIGGNARGAWLGVTLYVLFNWYQQDYFAPQAVAMQFYATIVAVLLWQLRTSPVPALTGSPLRKAAQAWSRTPGRVEDRDARWTTAMEAALVVVVVAMVISHQLTPLVTIPVLALFAAMGLTRYKLLWVAAVLVFVAWFQYGAFAYWQGHLLDILADVGGVDGNLTSSVTSRIAGDAEYGRMQYLRIGASLLLFGTATFGWFRLRHNKLGPIAGMLVIAPLSLVLVQSYGGEVVIRSFLYGSSVMAPLAATVLAPLLLGVTGAGGRRNWVRTAGAFVVFAGLATLVTTNRGLNTSFEQTPRETFEISQQVQSEADHRGIAYWGQHLAFTLPRGLDIPESCYVDAPTLADCTADADIDYIVDTRSDENYLRYRYGFSARDVDRLVEILLEQKGFVVNYQGESVRVLRRAEAPEVHLEAPE